MARLIRKKCARSLIVVKAGSVPVKGVVLISVDPVRVVKVGGDSPASPEVDFRDLLVAL